jgi:hypothetical protein
MAKDTGGGGEIIIGRRPQKAKAKPKKAKKKK